QRLTRRVSDSDRVSMPRRSRVRAGELLISRWRLPTWWVLILPLAVILKRFLAPDLVFILDILLSFTAPGRVRSPFVDVRIRARGSHLGLPRHVRPGRPRGAPSIRRAALAQGQSRALPLFLGRSVPAVARGRGGGFAGDPEILGFAATKGLIKALRGQPTFQQFPDRRRPAGHALGETPGVQSFQFFSSEHYLKPLTTGQIVHWFAPFPFYPKALEPSTPE